MTELESKPLAELHALAAAAEVPRYRMMPRAELIETLLGAPASEGAGSPAAVSPAPARPPRQRRRRFRRRSRKGVRLADLLLPSAPGRQAVVHAETRESCTALLREIAAEVSAASKGLDPVVLLVDPSPEELAEWRREAPRAEIVAAGQPRHAEDALSQASTRAGRGAEVIFLVDSLTRLAEAYGDTQLAKDFFDAGRSITGPGALTVVAALERK